MVTSSQNQNTDAKEENKERIKIDKLKLDKETVKDLTRSEEDKIQGGAKRATAFSCDAGCE